mgnify:CR=1 FL=1
MKDWKKVCRYPATTDIDFEDYVDESTSVSLSPIDHFMERCRELIILHGGTNSENEELVSQLVIAAAVGASEELFRDIFDLLTQACPESRWHLIQNKLRIELVERYGSKNLCRAFTSRKSLTSVKNINKACKTVTGLKLKGKKKLQVELSKFEKVSNLRHAAIHARGTLGHGNILSLLESNSDTPVLAQLVTNVKNVHKIIHFVKNIGRRFNRILFVMTIERWIAESTLQGDWESDKEFVVPIIEGFYSTLDMDRCCNPKDFYDEFANIDL